MGKLSELLETGRKPAGREGQADMTATRGGLNGLFGLSEQGLDAALSIRDSYRQYQPICVPGEGARILAPEHLLNASLDLREMDDPLPLAMMATRDPEPPMALAAATRLSPLGSRGKLFTGVVRLVGDTTRHPLVKKCLHLICDSAFDPDTIAVVQRHATQYVVKTRKQYAGALRENLKSLLSGSLAPRVFVQEFFKLTEAGNMRHDIRRKLVVSLLLSESVRPSIKFLMLENFERLPRPVRLGIIRAVLDADTTHHVAMIREELRWIVNRDRAPNVPPPRPGATARTW